MGRTRPYAISVLEDPVTGVSAVVLFDRQRGDFCAESPCSSPVRAERCSDLERKLRDEMRRGWGLRWAKGVVFERACPAKFFNRAAIRDGIRVELAYGFARGEYATRAQDGACLWRAWPLDEIDEDLPDGLNPPDNRVVSVLTTDLVVVPYHEGSWEACRMAALKLARIGEALEAAGDMSAIRRALDLQAFMKEHEPPPPPKPDY